MSGFTQWQLNLQAAQRYERILVPRILGPAARALVNRAAVQEGETVLDIGCGTGAAVRRAAGRVGLTGRVIGIDINPGMISVAKSSFSKNGFAVSWFVDSAYHLPLGDHTVDIALFAQTLQFLDCKAAALTEACRVLKRSGRAALSVWCSMQENPYFLALVEAVARHVGEATAAGLQAAFSLASQAEIKDLLVQAGFKKIELSVCKLDLEIPPLEDFVPRHISATPMAAGYRSASRTARKAVVREVCTRLYKYGAKSGLRLPFRTHLAVAQR
jgi:ubiquinone/menaquinone biosynthesis C-methylase UbiE